MIENMNISKINQCINLIEKKNTGKSKDRYFPNEFNKIRERIIKRLKSDDVEVLLSTENESVLGYMELYVDNREKYMQIYAFFADDNFEDILSSFLDYIGSNYPKYKLHYVVGDYNTDVIKYMEKINASSGGNETMITISRKNTISQEVSTVSELKEEHYNQFIKLHDSLYKEVFWTGELIIKEERKFYKYVIIRENQLVGFSVISNFDRDEEEIYYLYANNDEQKRQLINHTLKETFKRVNSVIMLLESNEKNDFPFYKEIGFQKKEVIITYSLEF